MTVQTYILRMSCRLRAAATACQRAVTPEFNRVVLFEVADTNFHAVRPVTRGSGRVRRSLIYRRRRPSSEGLPEKYSHRSSIVGAGACFKGRISGSDNLRWTERYRLPPHEQYLCPRKSTRQ